MLSVIIPTRNRATFLKDAVKSVIEQTIDSADYEILVVDNGSTDQTSVVIEELVSCFGDIRYFYESEPGLHVGRHLGAKKAKGDILVFIDDDIIASPQWLEYIKRSFEDEKTVLVGGRILPKWEGNIPDWLYIFRTDTEYGWTTGYLSLLDFGEDKKVIPPCYVYGCNFSIRKSVLWECGGFHPDGMPNELIKYRGDGETALSWEINNRGYKAVYEPGAAVYHRVTQERLSVEYFCRRAFNQGVSDSYSEIRRDGGLRSETGAVKRPSIFMRLRSLLSRENPVQRMVRESYLSGRRFHRANVESDPELLSYVMKERYF